MISASTHTDFDAIALHRAMEARRLQRGLSWRQVADEIWEQSSVLNRRRADHPISPSTLTDIAKRGDTTCQHALFILRWLGRTPESFLPVSKVDAGDTALPTPGPDKRLRWALSTLYEALDARRREQGSTWGELAVRLRCSRHQLTGIKTARYAIGMRLAMRIVQWLERPAAAFVHAVEW